MEQEVERIFRLMGLLFPAYDLHSAYFGLRSGNAAVRANALEFLDNILKPQLRSLLVPLLDSYVSVAERVKHANRLLGTEVDSQEQAVAVLLASDDPWMRSCAAYAIGSLGLRSRSKRRTRSMARRSRSAAARNRPRRERTAGAGHRALPRSLVRALSCRRGVGPDRLGRRGITG